MVIAIVIVLAVLLTIGLTTLASSVRVLREYERGVVFRLGRLMELRGPGLQLLMPTLDRMVRVSLRTVTLTVPPQEIITRDNVPARVTAVAYYRVIDPSKAVTEVENFQSATLQIAQTTLRSVLGVADLDTLLSEREHLNESLAKVIDTQTEPWGIKVTMVEIKDVEIPERMQHAIARQAEAERERRAKIINAEGEFQSAAKLAEAADVMSRNPTTLQLRYLQTLREIGGQQNSTIVFPMPIDLMRPMLEAMGPQGSTGQSESGPAAAAPQLDSTLTPELGPAAGPELGPAAEELPASLRERNGQAAETPPASEQSS
jgi:regulator of protease activity HflC (stomatin/prohibitin superfamily)